MNLLNEILVPCVCTYDKSTSVKEALRLISPLDESDVLQHLMSEKIAI